MSFKKILKSQSIQLIPLNKATVLVLIIAVSLFSSPALADSYKSKANLKGIKEIQNQLDKSVMITKIIKSRFLQVLYVVTIETCAGKDKLYSPELELKSDKESITIKISGLIMPKTCRIGEFFIRAGNPDSISVSFSNPSSDLQKIPH
jgi:hypothetical protein